MSSDATTIPQNAGTEDVTLTSTPLSEVAVTPSDIAAEKVPPSDVFQQEAAIVTGDSVTRETISSSDAPTLSSEVTTAVDIVTEATIDSRIKLQRQHAVDDELIAATHTENTQASETIDNITKSVNGLSIGNYVFCVCMCVCVCMCMYVCAYVCTYVSVYTVCSVCMYLCVYVCTYVHTYACVFVHVCIHVVL